MFVILIDEYFDEIETPCYSTVKGYFSTYEFAEEYLLKYEFRKVIYPTVNFDTGLGYDEVEYTNKNEYDLAYSIASIRELTLIK